MNRWSLVHCSDPHLGYNPDGIWNNRVLTTKSYEIFRTFLSDISYKDIDLLVISGDISSYDNQDAIDELIKIFDTIKCRIILTGGNHDFILPEHRSFFFEILTRYTHQVSLPFLYSYNGVLFCSMGITCFLPSSDGGVPCIQEKKILDKDDKKITEWVLSSDELLWLENVIMKANEEIIFINIHSPLLPIPDRCKFPGFKYSGTLSNADKVVAFLTSYSEKYFVILSGHTHSNYITTHKNITQIVTSSLCEFPCEYRIIKVFDDRMEVETHGLSNPKFAEASLIKGKELTQGKEEDRRFSLYFSKACYCD